MLRSIKERVIQTLAYETGGVVLATPIISNFVDISMTAGAVFIVVVTVLGMIWTVVHNTIYDYVEWRLMKRVASDRSGFSRVLHIFSLEASSIVFCVPLILYTTNMSLLEAVLLDMGLTIGFMAYGLLFYIAYDHLYPVGARELSEHR